MRAEYTWGTRARYYSSVSVLYLATLLFALFIFQQPAFLFHKQPPAGSVAAAGLPHPPKDDPAIITGTPVRIVVPSTDTDLQVDQGNYNSIDQTWTLSGYNAQFATPSMPPNDKQGNTLIYGHNNKYVFGPLKKLVAGDVAELFTDNGHTFFYTFDKSESVKPDNMIVFQYQGPPTLVIQTCTGNWNEWRTLYSFKFERVQ